MVQGSAEKIKAQIGTDCACIENAPFVTALQAAKKFVVVRNSVVDLYGRAWCVCDLMFARKLGFIPESTFVTGPDCFRESRSSCLDAKAFDTDDKAKVLRFLLEENDYKEIDTFVDELRAQAAPI